MARELGVVRRSELALSDGMLSRAAARGAYGHLLHGWYSIPGCELTPDEARRVAAVLTGGRGARLECVSAMAHRGLIVPHGSLAAHVAIPHDRSLRNQRLLRVHRYADEAATSVHYMPSSGRATAIVEAFGCVGPACRRQLILENVQDRRVLAADVRAAAVPGSRAIRSLLHLLDYIDAGCRSELEIKVLRSIVRRFNLPEPELNYEVRLRAGTVRFDAAFVDHKLALEADSEEWHFSAPDRPRDLRRDVLLAGQGWQTLRITNERMRVEPAWIGKMLKDTLLARAAHIGTWPSDTKPPPDPGVFVSLGGQAAG
ncbi:MAG: hypothetical protein ABI912_04690 [Actinomycetota bacterium]